MRLFVGVGLAVIALVGGYAFFESRKESNQERERFRGHGARVEALQAELEKDVCNRVAANELTDLYVETKNERMAVELLDRVSRACPPDAAIVARAVRLRIELGLADQAVLGAAKLIEMQPRRAIGYSLRAEARARHGDEAAAENDWRQALELDPGDAPAADSLAELLEKRGDLCAAADVLDELLARRAGSGAAERRARSEVLRRDGGCPRERIVGDDVIVPYENKGDVMVVTVKLDDKHEARMILDTGASSVAITRSLANRMNLDTSGAGAFYVATASGLAPAYRVRLKSVALGGARVERVRAAVVDRMQLGDVEGLLGNSFLSRFQVRVDSATGKVVLSRR